MAKAKKKRASVRGEKRFRKVKIAWSPTSSLIPLQTQEPPPLLNRDRYSKVGV